MIHVYTPRPYQSNCIAALAEARENGVKKGLVVMASGLGKTLTAIFDLQQLLKTHPSTRVLCLCHQEGILLQSKEKFRKVFGEEYSYGMFTGNYKTTHPVSFLFATFQTMRDHREEFSPDAFDYIVVDEAHHTAAETYQPTANYFVPQFLLGLTATKDRMDGQDILDTYEQVLYQMDIYDGWAEGWLARVDYRIMLDDLNEEEFKKYVGPHATSEKVSLSQLNKTIFAPQHDEGIVASIREQIADLEDPSIFIFCFGIDHANAMAHQFGGEAAVIHSGQSTGLNEAILSEFRSGGIRIIVSVDMLNEGIDVPEADVVVFLRATESSTIFFQQLGRGLRISGKKRTVRVLDYVANIERIATILEMEETAKQRIPANPTYSPSASKPDPLIVNIPATKFKVERVEIEQLLRMSFRIWSDDEVIETYYAACLKKQQWLPLVYARADKSLPSRGAVYRRQIADFEILKRRVYELHPKEAQLFEQNSPTHLVSTQSLIRRYYVASVEAGHWLTGLEIDANPALPCRATYTKRINGNVAKLQSIASDMFGELPQKSLHLQKQQQTRQNDADAIFQAYFDACARAGRWLTTKEITACSELPSVRTLYRRSGCSTIDEFRRTVEQKIGIPFDESQRIMKQYYEACLKVNRWITEEEFKKDDTLPSMCVLRKVTHGGVLQLREAVRKYYSVPDEWDQPEDYLATYYNESCKNNQWLNMAMINASDVLPSYDTMHYRYGGIQIMQQLAIKRFGVPSFMKNN